MGYKKKFNQHRKNEVMEKSNSIANLAKALIIFHVKVDKIKKDTTNPWFKKKYASLSTILDAINTPLNEAGLCVLQFPQNEHGLTTILIHGETGEYLEETYTMKPVKDDPQGRGSVISYQRRYALSAILALNVDDDDDDANDASGLNDKKAVQNNSTSYNHKEIAKPGLPHISNEQFKKMMDLIRGGDAVIFERTKKKYSFESAQLNAAIQATNKLINQPQTN